MKTRTGGWPIGFRRRNASSWQRDLSSLIEWARANDLEAIDLERDGDRGASAVIEAGLAIGSVDLLEEKAMLSPDRGKRAEAIARNTDYIRACATHGPINHFVIMLPERPAIAAHGEFHLRGRQFRPTGSHPGREPRAHRHRGMAGTGGLSVAPQRSTAPSLRRFHRR